MIPARRNPAPRTSVLPILRLRTLLIHLLTLTFALLCSSFLAAQQAAPAPKPTAADTKLQALYTADWQWRQHLRGDEDDDETAARLRPQLPASTPRAKSSVSSTGHRSCSSSTRSIPHNSPHPNASTTRSFRLRSKPCSTLSASANTKDPSTPTAPSGPAKPALRNSRCAPPGTTKTTSPASATLRASSPTRIPTCAPVSPAASPRRR